MGAFVTVFCLFWALQFGGLASMLTLVAAGNPVAIGWAVFAGGGLFLLLYGILEALSHDDDFEGGSFLYSVGVIGLALYGLTHEWYLSDGSSVLVSRAAWFAWMASNAFNIWLQLRGRLRGLRLPRLPRPQPRRAPRFSLRHSRRVEVIDEIEGDIEAMHHALLTGNSFANPPPRVSPHVIEHDGNAPQIAYVRQPDGSFVEVRLPGAVPVNRRLR